MRQPPQWQQHELPDDFTITHLVEGSFGYAMFGGNLGDRAALAFTEPTLQVLELDGRGMLTVASNGGTIIAATAEGGHYWAEPPYGSRGGSFRRHDLPRSSSGDLPVMAWGSAGDREFRLVLAYPAGAGHELGISSDVGGGLVATRNTLYAPHDMADIQVTSHQGVLLVGGPVSEDQRDARGCQVWLCDDPDEGNGGWVRRTLDPAPVALTHQVDGAIDWWWVGHDGQRIAVWDDDDTGVLVPEVAVDCAEPQAFLASAPHGETAPTLATQTAEGSFIRWLDEGRWRMAPLPEGHLQGALRSPRRTGRYPGADEQIHVVVDGKAWWMSSKDIRRLGQ